MSGRIVAGLGAVAIALMVGAPALAAWDVGGIPASVTARTADSPAAVADGAGGVVLVWADRGAGSVAPGVYVQHMDERGERLWGEEGVRVSTVAPEVGSPRIVRSEDGWWVAWSDSREGVRGVNATRVDASGIPARVDGYRVADTTDAWVDLLALPGGDAIVVTVHQFSATLYGQRITPSGALLWGDGGVAIDTRTGGRHVHPQVLSDGDGGAMVVWEYLSMGYASAYARRVGGDGSLQWPGAVRLSDYSWPGYLDLAAAACDDGVVVAHNYHGTDVVVQRIDRAGAVYWNDPGRTGALLCPTWSDGQSNPAVAVDGNGDAVVAFLRDRGAGASEVYAQKLSLSGAMRRGWGPEGVRVQAANAGVAVVSTPRVVPNSTGGTLVSWYGADGGTGGVFVQSLASAGDRFWGADVELSGGLGAVTGPAMVAESGGGSYAVWAPRGTENDRVYVSRVTRITEPTVTTQRNGGERDFRVTFAFRSVGGPVSSIIERGASKCGQVCSYTFADTTARSSYHTLALVRIAATLAYCYRIIPGGLPIYSGTVPLVHDVAYPVGLDLEDAYVDTDADCLYPTDDGPPCYSVVEVGDTTYWGHRTGNYDYCPPPRIVDERRMGRHALAIELPPAPASTTVTQRVEVNIDSDYPFYKERWMAFSMFVPDTSEVAPVGQFNWIMQIFQDNEVAPQVLALHDADGELLLTALLANDINGYCSMNGHFCQYGTGPVRHRIGIIPRARWVDVMMSMTFDPTGECGGHATFWLDGVRTVDYRGQLGMSGPFAADPACGHPVDPGVTESMITHKFGAYRYQSGLDQVILYDEIRVGTTRDEVELPGVKIFGDDVRVSDGIDGYDAALSFATDVPVATTVRYGPASDGGGVRAFGDSMTTAVGTVHTVSLTGLSQPVRYRIEARDAGGRVAYIDGLIRAPGAGGE